MLFTFHHNKIYIFAQLQFFASDLRTLLPSVRPCMRLNVIKRLANHLFFRIFQLPTKKPVGMKFERTDKLTDEQPY